MATGPAAVPIALAVRIRPGSSTVEKLSSNRVRVKAQPSYELECDIIDQRCNAPSLVSAPQQLTAGHHVAIIASGVDFQPIVEQFSSALFHQLATHSTSDELCVRCSVVECDDHWHDLLYAQSSPAVVGDALSGAAAVSCLSGKDITEAVALARQSRSASAAMVVQLVVEVYETASDTARQSRCLLVDTPSLQGLPPPPISLAQRRPLQRLLAPAFGGPYYTTMVMSDDFDLLSAARVCQSMTNTPSVHPYCRWQECAAQLAAGKLHHERLLSLTTALAAECVRLRHAPTQYYARNLWQAIGEIQQSQSDQRPLDFTVATANEHEVRKERAKSKADLRLAQAERDRAVSQASKLQSQVTSLQNQLEQLRQETQTARQQVAAADEARRQAELAQAQVERQLQTSLFRESEAVVLVRQFRKFYVRLLLKTQAEGSGDVAKIAESIPGAPDLKELQDLDQHMIEAGLLEENEKGVDAPVKDYQPSRSAALRSDKAAAAAAEKVADLGGSTSSALGPLAVSLSLMDRHESGEATEARQRLFQTPSGRYIELREMVLEKELLELSSKVSLLQQQLSDAQASARVTARTGLSAASEAEKQVRQLQQKLDRKEKDMKVVVWKMNELHVSAKAARDKLTDRDKQIKRLEETVAAVEKQSSKMLADREAGEKKLRDELTELLKQQTTNVPIEAKWDPSAQPPPFEKRMVLPFSSKLKETEEDVKLRLTAASWLDKFARPGNRQLVDSQAQTDGVEVISAPQRGVSPVVSYLAPSPDVFLFMKDDDDSVVSVASEKPERRRVVPPPTTGTLLGETIEHTETENDADDEADMPAAQQREIPIMPTKVLPAHLAPGVWTGQSNLERSDSMSADSALEGVDVREVIPLYDHAPQKEEIKRSKGPSLSSYIMSKLRAKAEVVDDDEKSETPEFMRKFKQIGSKNMNEEVIETQGAAAARDLTRTAFGESLRGQTGKPVDPATFQSSSVKWTPKKKSDDDSDSSDDSFAKSFMSGAAAQMPAPGASELPSPSNSSSKLEDSISVNLAVETNEDKKKAVGFRQRDSIIGVADFIDNTSYPSVGNERSPWSDSESSNKDETAQKKMDTIADASDEEKHSDVEEEPAESPFKKFGVTARAAGPAAKAEEEKKKVLPWMRPDAKPIAPKETPWSKAGPKPAPKPKNDSDDSSSEEEKRVPAWKRPAPQAPAPIPAPAPVSASKDDSDDDEKPTVPAWKKPAAPAPASPSKKVDDSDSDDDSSEDEKPKVPAWKKAATPAPALAPKKTADSDSEDDSSEDEKPKTPAWKKLAAPTPKKADSDSEEESSDEDEPPKTAPITRPKKADSGREDSSSDREPAKSMAKPSPSAKDDSDESSSDEEPVKPVARSAKEVESSDEESSDEETPAPRRPVAARKTEESDDESSSEEGRRPPPKPTAKAEESSEEDESSDEETSAPKEATPPPAPAAHDESSEYESSDEETPAPKAVPPRRRQEESSDEEESSVDEKVAPKPAPREGSDEESSSDEEDAGFGKFGMQHSKPAAAKPANNIMDRIRSKMAANKRGGGKRKSKKAEAPPPDDPFASSHNASSADPFASERAERSSDHNKNNAFGAEPYGSRAATSGSEDGSDSGNEDESFFSSKSGSFEPQRKVPDFGSQVTPSLTTAANKVGKSKSEKKEKAKFVIRNGKLVKSDEDSAGDSPGKPASKKPKAKFVIKGGKLVKDDSAIITSMSLLEQAPESEQERRNSLDSKIGEVEEEERETRRAELTMLPSSSKKKNPSLFVIKDGKLVKAESKSAAPASTFEKTPAKPAFSIVNGKLVKTGDTSGKKKKSKSDTGKSKGKKKKKK